MSKEDFITAQMNQLDPRLSKQPRWVQEQINKLLNQIHTLQLSVSRYERKSEDSDGRVRRGYGFEGAGEHLPSNDVYFFQIGESARTRILVRLDKGKLYINGSTDVLKIQPQAYNAFYITGE